LIRDKIKHGKRLESLVSPQYRELMRDELNLVAGGSNRGTVSASVNGDGKADHDND
jgi:hypothetical protein